jgi:hypothetical protein
VESASHQPTVSSLDETAVITYRSISLAAVLALVFGCASALALIHPFLWVIPVVTIVIAVVAMRGIAREGANLTGRGLAITGLVLALFFGCWAPTRILTRQSYLYRQARPYADQWLELVRDGKIFEAHQLMQTVGERQKPDASLEVYYNSNADARKQLGYAFELKPALTMRSLADKVTYQYVSGDGVSSDDGGKTHYVSLRYLMRYDDHGLAKEMPIRIVLQRSSSEQPGVFHWNIRGVADPYKVGT